MSSRLLLIAVILLTTLTALGQTTDGGIQNEFQLVAALCRYDRDQRSRELLLSQTPQLVNVRLWRQLINRASAAYYGPSPKESLTIYELAIDIAHKLNSPRLLATTYYNLGRTHSALNQIPSAIEDYEKSRANFEQAGLQRELIYVLADLGAFYFILEDYQKARDYSEQSISLAEKLKTTREPPAAFPDDFGRARAFLTLGEDDSRNGSHEGAIERLEQSLALYQHLNAGSHSYDFYIGGVYGALGRAYPEVGDSARALLCLNKALAIASGQADTRTIASLRNDMGFLYLEQEDYAQAKAQFDEGFKIYAAEGNQREQSTLLLNLGVVEQRMGAYGEAERYFRLSLQAARLTEFSEVQIGAYEGIGTALTAEKSFPEATNALANALAIAKRTSDRYRQAEILWRSAEAYYEMGSYEQSSTLATSAIEMAEAVHSRKLTYLATATLGQSYAASKKIDLAMTTLKSAVDQIEAMRDHVAGRDEERQLFFENKVSPYHTLVDLLVQRGKPLDALVYSERAKGRVLLDALRGGNADLARVLTPSERENTQRLNRDISDINEQIRKAETNRESVNALYARLDVARLKYQSFQDALYVSHPELSVRGGRAAPIDYSGIDNLTRNAGSAYLEFVVGKDRVFMFVLTTNKSANGFELKTYPVPITPNDLVRKVDQFHGQVANLNPDYTANARELYDLLVAPAAEQTKGADTLCIVPDGFLWNLPFQALMPASDRFLLEDHAIYYAPSLTVLLEMTRKERSARLRNSLIAFGNPVIGKDEQHQVDLCPLPEAEKEVNSISRTVVPAPNKVFIGRDASEKTFKAEAAGFSVIHLATHGVIDNRNPLYSHLLLTKSEGDPDNDGLLEAREIMNLKLDADLAVLSGCETANGKIAPGEGVIGMTWAFFIAGTRSVLVSQWKVNSASTSQLMANFYQNLAVRNQPGEKARALRAGALRLMKGNSNRHPFFWAGFVLVGVN
ncbi:MAG TPA: CHAT domain-containing tetratricopeptide repeat protein [Pyrinomonadaceae bacterium]|nr:CHAT domain-containing tetratricopeptide repeat protein [Pyrinomonadaceae bacterium]